MIIPKDIPHTSMTLNVGERKIDLTVASLEPTARYMCADAFIDFGRNPMVERGSHLIVAPSSLGCKHYTGVINIPIAPEDFFVAVRDIVFDALKDVARNHIDSAWINFGSGLEGVCPRSVVDAYEAILHGVKHYAEYVEREVPATHVADIIIGASAFISGSYRVNPNMNECFSLATIFPPQMLAPVAR